MDNTDTFGALDFGAEEVATAAANRKINQRNGGVCICGHAAGAHSHYAPAGHPDHEAALREGRSTCIPSKIKCDCLEYQQVILAEDLRQFRFSTKGPGIDHALAQGLAASLDKGKKTEWAPGVLQCVSCKQGPEVGVKLSPVAYHPDRSEAYAGTSINVLICQECRDKTRKARA